MMGIFGIRQVHRAENTLAAPDMVGIHSYLGGKRMEIFDILTLLGGLGLFLYGMNVMGDGLKKLAGGRLESILSKLTSNKFVGFLLGFAVTAIIQSSSATTVMLVGFVNSGIMQFSQTLGVILGANLGTTVTGWILSLGSLPGGAEGGAGTLKLMLDMLKPSSFTPILMVIGVAITMMSKSNKKKNIALILVGFASLMFGMDMMSGAVAGLKDDPTFAQLMITFKNPILGILAGAILTVIIQSSSASVGILQALSMTGAIPFSVAIPVILGQNIGTTVTPILSAISGNTNSKRVAFTCLYIKVIGVTLVGGGFYAVNAIFDFPFMDMNVNMVTIAIVHTIFNLTDAILLLPFTKLIEKLAVVTIRSKKEEKSTRFDALDDRFLSVPSFAIEKCRDLVCEMAEISHRAVCNAIGIIPTYNEKIENEIQENEELVDMYEDKLSTHFVKLSSRELSVSDGKEVTKLLHCIGDLERIADHAVNISDLSKEMHEKKIRFSDTAYAELEVISDAVKEVLDNTINAFVNDDVEMARRVEPLEQVIDKLKLVIKDNHINRLQSGQCSIELGFILSDLLTNYERIADHCSNIAVCIIELSHGSFDTHEYLSQIKKSDERFLAQYEEYKNKYVIELEDDK